MIGWRDWGSLPYREAWDRQEQLRHARQQNQISDQLIFCEHPRVFTLGRRDCTTDWKAPADLIARAGIDIVPSNRGGKITYHGPGQLVVYWILDLAAQGLGIRDFVSAVETILIRTLANDHLTATRDPDHPGVWIGQQKIAAIGLHVRHGITQHGCAINYAVDLADYQYIVPCGITDRGVTSLDALGIATSHDTLRDRVIAHSAQVLQDDIVHYDHADCTERSGTAG